MTGKVREAMSEGKPGHTSKAQAVSTGARWYQSKRAPLWFVVAGTFAAAGTYLLGNRTQHPQVRLLNHCAAYFSDAIPASLSY